MRKNPGTTNGFTLLELMVVIAVIAIIAGLLMSAVSSARNRAKRTVCLNNLKQVNLGLRMYCDDANDKSPDTGSSTSVRYKQFMKSYVGLKGDASPEDKIFACPADTFRYYATVGETLAAPEGRHEKAFSEYSSYSFNGQNLIPMKDNHHPPVLPGIGGKRLSAIQRPARTIFVAEAAAFWPYSWHETKRPLGGYQNAAFNDSKNMVSFVDGHVKYIKMYWNSAIVYPGDQTNPGGWGSMSSYYDPPAGYEYQWSGD